ncbi:MAG: prepilin-type N-terminal cleavage/methylation domain-containing protein [Fimbriimonadaceae bacterium]|nr:prepilin-type N-terminal cleavage/methylation domain-containing protein [Fimbriimonadaceae bacterium]
MKKSAFTLIELLVVIAIIAILAAILFPVFAQAKQAAKKTASLSNIKQIGTATIIYQADYDDLYAPVVTWSNSGAPSFVGGVGFQPWTWTTLPYMKNTQIYQDPLAPPMEAWPATWNQSNTRALAPQYGYNYTVLSPYRPPNWPVPPTPISQTALGSPAETVMIGAKFSTSEDDQPATGFYWAGPGSWATTLTIEPPVCGVNPDVWCFTDWGTNSWYNGYLRNNSAAGAFTGGLSRRSGNKHIIVWADSHASNPSTGALARGTNWREGIDSLTMDWTTTDADRGGYLWDDR